MKNRIDFPRCPNCADGRMSVHADGCAWCDRCETVQPPGPPSCYPLIGTKYDVHAAGRRPSPPDEMAWLRTQVEQLSEQKIITLAAMELAAPHLCGAMCPSVKYDDKPWSHCDECKTVTAAIELARGTA